MLNTAVVQLVVVMVISRANLIKQISVGRGVKTDSSAAAGALDCASELSVMLLFF